jgi:hypothetical protein
MISAASHLRSYPVRADENSLGNERLPQANYVP